jgi:hypothetical protein
MTSSWKSEAVWIISVISASRLWEESTTEAGAADGAAGEAAAAAAAAVMVEKDEEMEEDGDDDDAGDDDEVEDEEEDEEEEEEEEDSAAAAAAAAAAFSAAASLEALAARETRRTMVGRTFLPPSRPCSKKYRAQISSTGWSLIMMPVTKRGNEKTGSERR